MREVNVDKIELLEIVAQGEDYYTEFKEETTHPDDLAGEIVAFANSDGGRLIIGITDSGDIVGVKEPNKEIQRLDNICSNNCEPSILIKTEKLRIDKTLLLVATISKGPERPYRTNRGVYYIRTSSGKRQATREELLRLYQATKSLYYDELPISGSSRKDLDLDFFEHLFEEFQRIKVDDVGVSLDNLLKSMKIFTLSEERQLVFSLGGLLLFGKNPQNYLPYCKITVVKFPGNEISNKMEKKDIEGKLTDQITKFEEVIKIYIKSTADIRGFEKEFSYELPLESLREAIVNAIAHRDYHISSQIRVFIFKNRIEIISPGKLPNTVTLENIRWGGIHIERNPIIVSFLAKMGFMTQIGTGIIRMIRLLKEHTGREPNFEERDQEFIVRIWIPDL